MSKFRCIGPDCEDHCCQGWRINLDVEDYGRLKSLKQKSAAVAESFDEAVMIRDDEACSQKMYAQFNFREQDHRCFYEQQGLCVIHRDLGEAALPKTCATYPRKVQRFGHQYELSGSLSCPEVARLCLLDPDAMTLGSSHWDLLPERIDLLGQNKNLGVYQQNQGQLRDAFLQLMALHEPIETRVFYCLYLARQISSFFHAGMRQDPGKRLSRAIDRMLTDLYRDRIRSNFDDSQDPPSLALGFVSLILFSDGKQQVRFHDLVQRIFSDFDGFDFQNIHLKDLDNIERPVQQILAEYRRRKQTIHARFAGRVEGYFSNFCRNYWYQDLVGASDNPLAYVRQLILFFAVIKILFYSHPDLALIQDNPAQNTQTLDRVVVEVVQTFMKAFTHNNSFKALIQEALENQGLHDLAPMIALLKL